MGETPTNKSKPDFRDMLVRSLDKIGIPNVATATDEELEKHVSTLVGGRTWECSTCGAALYPWEECCG